MKLFDILHNSEHFSFFINGVDLAEKVVADLEKAKFSFRDPEMQNIITECPTNRGGKYKFDLWPRDKRMGLTPYFGSVSTDLNSFDSPVFSQDIMMFLFWVLKNEGSLQ